MRSKVSCCLELLSGCHFLYGGMYHRAPSHSPLLLLSHNYGVRYKVLLCATKAWFTQQYPEAMQSAHLTALLHLIVFLLCKVYQSRISDYPLMWNCAQCTERVLFKYDQKKLSFKYTVLRNQINKSSGLVPKLKLWLKKCCQANLISFYLNLHFSMNVQFSNLIANNISMVPLYISFVSTELKCSLKPWFISFISLFIILQMSILSKKTKKQTMMAAKHCLLFIQLNLHLTS